MMKENSAFLEIKVNWNNKYIEYSYVIYVSLHFVDHSKCCVGLNQTCTYLSALSIIQDKLILLIKISNCYTYTL